MKINSLIIGKGSGSAGNVTVVQLKGQSILKQKATNVSNPRSVLQVHQRKMINRGVFVWQLFGAVLKQGFTSLLPHSSQYNTFISANAAFFKSAIFTKETFTNGDLIGSVASKGSLGELQVQDAICTLGDVTINLNKANLNSVAKLGDKIVVVCGNKNNTTAGYGEIDVTAPLLASASPSHLFTDLNVSDSDSLVLAAFIVSEDNRKSTNSEWLAF
jgi:hypothetical protein